MFQIAQQKIFRNAVSCLVLFQMEMSLITVPGTKTKRQFGAKQLIVTMKSWQNMVIAKLIAHPMVIQIELYVFNEMMWIDLCYIDAFLYNTMTLKFQDMTNY